MTSHKDRPADTPAYRRYLQAHPEAADLNAAELTEHAYRQARRELDAIRRALGELDPREPPDKEPSPAAQESKG